MTYSICSCKNSVVQVLITACSCFCFLRRSLCCVCVFIFHCTHLCVFCFGVFWQLQEDIRDAFHSGTENLGSLQHARQHHHQEDWRYEVQTDGHMFIEFPASHLPNSFNSDSSCMQTVWPQSPNEFGCSVDTWRCLL